MTHPSLYNGRSNFAAVRTASNIGPIAALSTSRGPQPPKAPARAERPGGRLHAKRAGAGPAGPLLDLWDRAAEVRRRRIHSFPPRPSGLPARSTAVSPRPRPLPLGRQVTQWLWSTASAHGHGATSTTASAQGCKSTALISTAVSVAPACVPAGSGEMCVARRVQGVRDGTAPARISGVEPAATAPGI